MTNRLPTKDDGFRIGVRFKDEFGDQEFFLFPLDWGAARVADLIDKVRDDTHLRYIRYDLPVSPYSTGEYRRVTKPGTQVRSDIESGRTLLNTPDGPLYTQIPPVDFSDPRYAVFLEDWLGFTGQALKGGAIWGLRNQKVLNLGGVYTAALEAFRDISLPTRFERSGLVRGLLLPYDKYPVTNSYTRRLVGAVDGE